MEKTLEQQLDEALAEIKRLRERNASLNSEVSSLSSEVSSLSSEKESMGSEITSLNAEISSLKDQLAWLRKKVFGKMSEKHLPLDPAQLLLFEESEMSDAEKEQLEKDVRKAEESMDKAVGTKKSKPSRKPLDDKKYPVIETVHIYPSGTTDESGALKKEYVEIGTEVTRCLEVIPAKVGIKETFRHKVMLVSDMEKHPEDREIITPELPLAPIPKCIAGASLLASLVIDKYMYHLPFYRQIQQYKEYGVILNDSTMGGWFEETMERLHPLYKLLKKKVLSSEYVQADESTVPVIDNETHKTRKGYEWCARDGITGDVIFYYDRGSRSGGVVMELFGDYKGSIQCDGYSAYDILEKMPGVVLYGCWAHLRRKLVEALDENCKLATEGICFVKKLYKVESDADDANMSAEERANLRMKVAYPVIQSFEKWLMDTYPMVLPQSRMGKAIAYAYTLLPRLARYVNDGRIAIDNNAIERQIRPLACGRKNYMFCGNDAAAYRAAIAYSLIGTCKAAGVEPREWMTDVLEKLPYYHRDGRDMSELLPRAWKENLHK